MFTLLLEKEIIVVCRRDIRWVFRTQFVPVNDING